MTSPASFPATASGYRAYVKSCGFDLNNPYHQGWYMDKSKFMSVERRSIEDIVEDELTCVFHALDHSSSSLVLNGCYDALVKLSDSFKKDFIDAGLSDYLVRCAEDIISRIPECNRTKVVKDIIEMMQNKATL